MCHVFQPLPCPQAFGYMYVLATGLLGALLLSTFMEQNAWFMPFLELVPGFALYR